MYGKKVMEYFMNPKHVGVIENADAIGEVGNIYCGDKMWLYLKIEEVKDKKIIKNVRFKTLGCVAAIASSEALARVVEGKTINEALEIKDEDILKELGSLPDAKIHCSLLAINALKEAIYNYFKKNNIEIPEELENHHKKILKMLEKAEERRRELEKN